MTLYDLIVNCSDYISEWWPGKELLVDIIYDDLGDNGSFESKLLTLIRASSERCYKYIDIWLKDILLINEDLQIFINTIIRNLNKSGPILTQIYLDGERDK